MSKDGENGNSSLVPWKQFRFEMALARSREAGESLLDFENAQRQPQWKAKRIPSYGDDPATHANAMLDREFEGSNTD